MTAYFDRTWPVSNVKRNDSASQNIQVKKKLSPYVRDIQNVDEIVFFSNKCVVSFSGTMQRPIKSANANL